MFTVRVDGSTGSSTATPIEVVPFVIGREADCDLMLQDERVSRHHAQLEVQEDGRVVLRDLGSANGTFVDEHKVEGGVWFEIPGTFRVGRTNLSVQGTAGAAIELAASPNDGAAGDRLQAIVASSSLPRPRAAIERDPPRRMTLARVFLAVIGAFNVVAGVFGLTQISELPGSPLLLVSSSIASLLLGIAALAIAVLLPRREPRIWQLAMGVLVAWIAVSLVFVIIVIVDGGPPTTGLALILIALTVSWLRNEKSWWVPASA